MSIALVFTVGNIPKPPEKLFLINKKPSLIYIREGVIRSLFVLFSLEVDSEVDHKMKYWHYNSDLDCLPHWSRDQDLATERF